MRMPELAAPITAARVHGISLFAHMLEPSLALRD